MNNAIIGGTNVPNAEATNNNYRFFDPKPPETPEQLFGIETEAILRLGRAATALGVLPSRVNLGLYALPDAVRLVPLVQEMQSGTILTPEDVRPYRRSIKALSPEASSADGMAILASVVGVGIPARRALNRKIEQEFPDRAAKAIDEAREKIASLESSVDYVASFENPREQFVNELDDLAQTVSTAITEQRDRRVQDGIPVETQPEVPRGIMGFFTKAVRKIRSFFKPKKPAVNPEVTAYDAGAGIQAAVRSLAENYGASAKRFPMLSKMAFAQIPNNMNITKDRLAFMAPEILNFLFSALPQDSNVRNLMESVKRNPHELRFVTRFKHRYAGYSLPGIQNASHTLMPAIRDVLPTEGTKVREIFDQARELLQHKQLHEETEIAPQKGIRNRLKHLFRSKRPDEKLARKR